jgi:hypothetical protein
MWSFHSWPRFLNTFAQCDCGALTRLDERGRFKLTRSLMYLYDTDIKPKEIAKAILT